MKQIIIISIAFLFFSFKGYKTIHLINTSNATTSLNDYYYTSAKSGLNYRETPKGKVLGKFSLNTHVKVIEKTKIVEAITDGDNLLKGEWVGIIKGSDTVYVFDAYLSVNYTFSDINIYNASPYSVEDDGARTGFLNLSDTYFNTNSKREIIHNSAKDTVILNVKQRKYFLKKTKILETDNVYIIDLNSKKTHTFKVKDLPAIAVINIYVSGEGVGEYEESDYEFGFDLGKSNISYTNFAYIGKSNPFQTEKVTSIVWEPIDNKNIPIPFDVKIIDEDRRSWFDKVKPDKSYKFTHNNYDYYLQNLKENGNVRHRYLVVIDTDTNQIVYNDVFIDSESTSLAPLNIEGEKPIDDSEYTQYTGEIFKNKPPIIYGFLYISFGCESIDFLSNKEPSIYTLCDNRH